MIYFRFRCFFFGLSPVFPEALGYWTLTGFKIFPSRQYTLPLMNFNEQWVQWLPADNAGWQAQGQLGPPKSSSSSSKLIFSSKVALSSSSSSLKSMISGSGSIPLGYGTSPAKVINSSRSGVFFKYLCPSLTMSSVLAFWLPRMSWKSLRSL